MRRLVPTTIVLMTLLLAAVTAAPGVSAQDTSQHPAVGAWRVDPTPEDTTDPPEIALIFPGGIIINTALQGSAYGSWAESGDRTADATFLFPLGDAEGGFEGYGTVRTSIEVAEDGQTFTGTYTYEFPAGMAEAIGMSVGQLGPGQVTGQRIAVDLMGEPVGPLPGAEGPAEEVSSSPAPSPEG